MVPSCHSYYDNHKGEFLVVVLLIFVPLKVTRNKLCTWVVKCRQLYIHNVSSNWLCVLCRHSNFSSVVIRVTFKTITLGVRNKNVIVSIQNRAGPKHVVAPGQAYNLAPPSFGYSLNFFELGQDWRKFFRARVQTGDNFRAKFLRAWKPLFASTIFPIIPVTA